MSSISTIYDNLLSLVSTAIGGSGEGYIELPNPYNLADNNQLFLKKGYGVAIGPGVGLELHVGCRISYERIFTVVLTKEMATTDHNITARTSFNKELIEDFVLVRRALEDDPTLSQACIKTQYTADSGLEFTATDTQRFISVSIDVIIQYEENL